MTDIHPLAFSTVPNLKTLISGFPGLKALFFDMDGTLFNTEPHHEQAFIQIGLEHKIRAPFSKEVIHELLVGKADYLVFEIVKDWEGFPAHWSAKEFVEAKNEHLLKILQKSDPTSFFPNELKQLLIEARTANMYLALVTSSEKVIAKKLLEIAGLKNFFNLELTRDDCPNHKPDPWPYLEAQRLAGVDSHEILIFEDSHVGLAAATSSGAHVIKVEWY